VQYFKSSVFATLLFLTFSMSLQAAAPVAGVWLLEVDGPRGKSTPTLTVSEQAPGEFSGSLTGPRGSFAIDNVAVEGNAFSFLFQMKTAFGTFELKYAGQVDQDTMTGSVETPRGDTPFTGKRQ
jgi:hypothetical protein